MRKHFVYILGILLILSVSHCAKRGTPTGGAKDSLPPVLIRATPPLNTTLFDEEKITLLFDEYIKLKDITNQLNIYKNNDGFKIERINIPAGSYFLHLTNAYFESIHSELITFI